MMKRRTQPRLPDRLRRIPAVGCFDPRIEARIAADSRRWGYSRSWIINTAVAAFYHEEIAFPATLRGSRRGKH